MVQNDKMNLNLIEFLQKVVVYKIRLQMYQEAESGLWDIIKIVKKNFGLRGACLVDPVKYLFQVYAQLIEVYEQQDR